MTAPDDQTRPTPEPEEELELAKETLKDLDASEEEAEDAKGGRAFTNDYSCRPECSG